MSTELPMITVVLICIHLRIWVVTIRNCGEGKWLIVKVRLADAITDDITAAFVQDGNSDWCRFDRTGVLSKLTLGNFISGRLELKAES
jgi:hypothetical protein